MIHKTNNQTSQYAIIVLAIFALEQSSAHYYNGNGIRTSKTVGTVTTNYTTIDGRITSQKTGDALTYFYYDSDSSLLGMRCGGNDYIYLKNLQGDVVGIVNTSGAIVAEYSYDAWGNSTSTTGDAAIAAANPFRYRSYYFDSETSLYYLQSRYYDSEVGRFINADDPELLGSLRATDEVLGANLFAYCGNDPIGNEDPSGRKWLSNIGSWFKKTEFSIKTWLLALTIDAVLAILSSGGTLSFSVVGAAMKVQAKKELAEAGTKIGAKAGANIAKLLFQKIPKIVGSSFLTAVRTAIWRLTGVTLYWLKQEWLTGTLGIIGNYLRGAKTASMIIDVVMMFTSFGAFIAGMMDICDGRFDGKVVFKESGY
jgi:RHS repeat-associated protein